MRLLEPQPAPGELPARFPSPFAREPHPLARRAAEALVAELRAGLAADARLDAPGGGKMFGVLVCAGPAGIGVLRAFSGMLGGRWRVPGFAPPVFDEAARDAWWPAGEAELGVLAARQAGLADSTAARAAHAAAAAIAARHAAERAALAAAQAERRAARAAARSSGAAAAELAAQSQRDTRELREAKARHAAELAAARAPVTALEAAIAALAAQRAARSRELLAQIHAGYVLTSARGETRDLRALFAPDAPPGGAGDCAAPKLLAHAQRLALRPLALAEVWWGAPPEAGGRIAGAYYPACRGKCGPILPFLLEGLDAEPAPRFGGGPVAGDEPRALYADAALAVVAKPCGLLSVPGRSGALRDSALVRLRARYGPDTTVVHRLDLDTSGVLLAARDAETHARLQALFARREVEKRYVAWLAGEVHGETGEIALPLRVDLDDRPRQIVDEQHGKPAITAWRVLAREPGRTRVELVPLTGRTHQLRVHCAHPRGLGAPIAGDPLYGTPGERLALHAEAIAFVHPHTGARVEVCWPAPF